jgi:hypothetical protein
MGFFDVWKDALMKPFATFEKMKKGADLMEGFKHVLVAGVIAGVLGAIGAYFGLAAVASAGGPFGSAFAGMAMVGILIGTPIMAVIGWLLMSLVYFVFAKLLGGSGSYTLQTYLIALYTAPLMVLSAVVGLIPVLGSILGMLLSLYGLYLLTMALKSAHGFDTIKAALVWIIPVVILVILVLVLGVAILGSFLGGLGGGALSSYTGV